MTPPSINGAASMTSTLLLSTACNTVVKAVTNTIWNTDVPMTMRVGMPSR